MLALSGVACLILIVLGAALYVGGVFNGTTSSRSGNGPPITTPASSPATTPQSPPVTTQPDSAGTQTATTPAATPAATPPAPSPAQVIRTHLQDLGSGNYSGAFALMSSAYRSQNPSWPSDRTAADPHINIVSIGAPQYGSGTADVPVDFFARDHNPTPGSDTQCRQFQGTAHLIKQGGSWRYDPSGDSLSATASNGNPSCPA